MIKKLLTITIASAILVASCKKDAIQPTVAVLPKTTSAIVAPTGFTWENARSITFTVNVIDNAFPTKVHVISIYDGSPAAGGNLLSKGSALTTSAFKSKLYLSSQITEVFIMGAFPNGSKILQKMYVGKTDMTVNVGL